MLCFSGVLGEYKDLLWRMSSIPLTAENITSVIPQSSHTFIFFYANSYLCKSKADTVNKAILDIRKAVPALNVYRIDGTYSPEVINSISAIHEYPTLGYYYPGEREVTSVFRGRWTKEGVGMWLSLLLGLPIEQPTEPECNKGKIELEGVLKFHEDASVNITEENIKAKEIVDLLKKYIDFNNGWKRIIYSMAIGIVIGVIIGCVTEFKRKLSS
eukprot:TRINITY_DN5252_c0_g2_i2.p1 TRINITY_DN5252_c0_g2~~TRINITY_DN5252_c0_g2_i2.p1  ORF type:complete len:214 (-),score=32.73 TRINITY_DN5252_c0_g2_i2:111-752(-)